MNHDYIAELDGPQSRIIHGKIIQHGKGGGTVATSSTSTPTIPDELKPLANLYTQQATQYAQTPFQSYTGQRFADLNPTQNAGIGMVQQRALGGDQTINAGTDYLQNQLTSGPTGATANPYGPVTPGVNSGLLNAGVNSGFTKPGQNTTSITAGMNTRTVNPSMNTATVQAGQNQYAGANPYLDDAVRRAQSSVVDQFNLMTKPQTETAMRNSGSFGNSGLQQMLQQQQKMAGEQLGSIASGMYMQDYGNQQQLAESAINRSLGAQQFNSGIADANIGRDLEAQQFNAGLMGDDLSRAMQAQQFNSGVTDSNLNRAFQSQQFNSGVNDANIARNMTAQQFNIGQTDANLARNMQAQQLNAQMGQDYASRNDAALNNWRSSNLNAAQLGLNYGNAPYQDASQLMNAGNIQQQQSQNNLDFGYQQFQQAQDHPLKQMSATGGMLQSNMGSSTEGVQPKGGK